MKSGAKTKYDNLKKQVEAARRDCICVLKPNPQILAQSDRKTMIKHLLMAQRKD